MKNEIKSAKRTPQLYTYEPFFQKSWIRPEMPQSETQTIAWHREEETQYRESHNTSKVHVKQTKSFFLSKMIINSERTKRTTPQTGTQEEPFIGDTTNNESTTT